MRIIYKAICQLLASRYKDILFATFCKYPSLGESSSNARNAIMQAQKKEHHCEVATHIVYINTSFLQYSIEIEGN